MHPTAFEGSGSQEGARVVSPATQLDGNRWRRGIHGGPPPHVRKLLVAMVVVIVWGLGVFDHALARYGLASHECATNGLGVTFCGEELERYRREVVEPMRDAGRELDELRAGLER